MSILRWFLSFIGAQLLCGVVWFVGPLLPQLEPALPRIAIIAGIAAAWIIGNLALDLVRLSREKTLVAGVAGDKAEDAETAALQEKLKAAMQTLRKGKGRRGALYDQPWYVIIGPPGAGKTTALLNAGLEFPLAEQVGRGALSGVGGTRQCEWWFTDKAVMIDTAGRYTTQDSDASVDKAGWDSFLAMLRRARPRLPLNGVIVAIALADVVGDGGVDRALHARAIRRRIAELERELGVRIPVYALLTKADLLAGFTEFFGDLDREAREQVWGVTFGYGKGRVQDAMAAFKAEFKRWIGVLEQRMFARLQSEQNGERRALVSAFPAQFATVGAPLSEFLAEAFAPKERERAPLLRGVYFTSATQEGTPIDRLTGTIARAFGLEGAQARQLRPEDGRSFFLTGLLRDVVFREAMLGAASAGSRRRALALRGIGFAAVILLGLGGGVLLWQRQQAAEAQVETVGRELAAYEEVAARLPLDPVRDADLPALLPLLDRARALPVAGAWAGPLGLSQQAKLDAAASAVYRHGLEYALLPRLLWRLEAQLRGNLSDPEYEYEATRVYLMLGGLGPLDRDLVRQWVAHDWAQTYTPEIRSALLPHLDALLAQTLPTAPLDGQVVAAARATFGRVSVAQRAYSRIKPLAVERVPDWTPGEALGAAGVSVFVRASGKPFSDGIPGLFTPAGLQRVLLPSLGPALNQVAAESWVQGVKSDLKPDSPEMAAAQADVLKLYAAEYIQTWDAMLEDLDVTPLRSLPQAAQDLFILGSREHSPMRALLASAVDGTTVPAAPKAASSDADPRSADPAAGAGSPLATINAHFAPLHAAMQPGAFDQVLKPLIDLQQQLAKMAASANKAGATTDPGSVDPATALQTEALRQPPPLSRWLTSIAASGKALRGGGIKDQITAAFKAGGGVAALCPQVVTDKYPFVPAADKDASLDEFGRLFGAGGVIDTFFNTQLRPFVDTSGRVWKPQAVEGMAAPFAAADLAQFQRAQAIRDMFFAGGGTTPKLRLDITPLDGQPAGTTGTLDLGSGPIRLGGGSPQPMELAWPPADAAPASLAFAGGAMIKTSGPWALFRLFGRATVAGAGPDRAVATFQDGERTLRVELRAPQNPLLSHALSDFRCPNSQ